MSDIMQETRDRAAKLKQEREERAARIAAARKKDQRDEKIAKIGGVVAAILAGAFILFVLTVVFKELVWNHGVVGAVEALGGEAEQIDLVTAFGLMALIFIIGFINTASRNKD